MPGWISVVLIIFIALFLFAILRTIARRYKIRTPATMEAWKTYLRGQFVLLLASLVFGGVFSGVGLYLSTQYAINVPHVVKQYQIDPTKRSLIQESIQGYKRITLLARAVPDKTSAKISIFRNHPGESEEVDVIDRVSSELWTRRDYENSYPNIALLVEPLPPGDSGQPQQVQITLYLSAR